MQVYESIQEINVKRPTVVTVGTFDGIHLGHKYTFDCLINIAEQNDLESVIVTFSDHPKEIIQNRDVQILTVKDEKIELLRSIMIDHLLIIPFTRELASMNYKTFTKSVLIDQLKMKNLLFGYDHAFGKNREGSYQNLKDFGKQNEFTVDRVESVQLGNVTVSSTQIRQLLTDGQLNKANRFLGRPYLLIGEVVRGEQRGQSLGFPTANLKPLHPHKLIANSGVYLVKVEFERKVYHGMMNIGVNPTFSGTDLKLEVHIFDYNRTIYGEQLNIFFLKKLRNEQKFESISDLKDQLNSDLQLSKDLLRRQSF
ncbi:MAG: bifunctional riboflavin kinase/FAD synthetase [Calditrichaeota bacterium]|nr:bifunctional riboflavin kinase/FAD synthetase [Calditrichota bacterium]